MDTPNWFRRRLKTAGQWTLLGSTLVATITLLSLASHTRAPNGSNLQTQVGECRKPDTFVALLALSAARLGLTLAADVWQFHRRRKVLRDVEAERRRQLAEREAEIQRNRAYLLQTLERCRIDPTDGDRMDDVVAQMLRDALNPPGDADSAEANARANLDGILPPPPPARLPSSRSTQSLPLPRSEVQAQYPAGCGSCTACRPEPRPASAPGHRPRSSSSFSTASSMRSASATANPFPSGDCRGPMAPAPAIDLPVVGDTAFLTPSATRPTTPPHALLAASATSTRTQHDVPTCAHASAPTTPTPSASTPSLTYPPQPSSLAGTATSQDKAERWRQKREKWAATADVVANKMLNSMRLVHFVLFFVGSALCIDQFPNVRENNCFTGAPLLWWPLMVTSIIYGWLHVMVYLYFVLAAVIVILATGIYLIIAHFMGWPVRRFGVMRPRTPAPEKLTDDDLKACTIVAYVPDPDEPLPEPSIYEASVAEGVHGDRQTSQSIASALLRKARGVEAEKSAPPSPVEPEPKGEPVQPGDVDMTRLGLPGAVLGAHQVTCAICQSSFVPPREIPGRELYVVERLRQLPCKHVFHIECVDNWLLNHSGNCPYCSQNVKNMLKARGEAGAV